MPPVDVSCVQALGALQSQKVTLGFVDLAICDVREAAYSGDDAHDNSTAASVADDEASDDEVQMILSYLTDEDAR